MTRYMIQRLLLAVPTLLGVTIFISLLVRFIPGGAAAAFCAEGCTVEQVQEIERSLGLDRPWPQQYVDWLGGAFQGDLGESFQNRRAVADDILTRLPVTIQLGLMAMIIGLLIALPIGIISAIRQDTMIDYIARSAAVAWLSVPSFWIGTLIIAYAGKYWGWAPPLTYKSFLESPVDNLTITLLPALILGAALSGTVMRLSRAQMLEVLRQDYIRTAWSKGLKERTVISRHAIRNAFIPVITVVGLQVPILVGGSVIVETIFNVPGIGRYLVTAINQRDYPIIQGVNLVVATVVILTNVVVDVSYSLLDPRVRYS
ncbi:MAG: ABC transporter permease [Dehalococcoidia bacterium]